jgi:hypothetical protein
MSTNFYFNNFPSKHVTNEQLLVEDLVIEALKIYGMDVYYLPRTSRDSVDYLYGEDTLKQYLKAYSIEMYLENVTGMDGEGDFISKFGLEIRDEISLLVSRRRFKYTTQTADLTRPREGDLIYIPLVETFFEITFVENENDQAMFYTLGRGRGGNVYLYSLKLKQFVFSNEIVETGLEEIDSQIRDHYAKTRIYIENATDNFIEDDFVYQGSSLETATSKAKIYYYNKGPTPNAYIDIYRVEGNFVPGSIFSGSNRNISANVIVSSDTATMDNPFEDLFDNNRLQIEGESFIDWSESNPFGTT